ncbi:MAG: NUDIX domain-containing protein [Oscillospiraceae bacterium]|nr:NUDIX domain-containing protein [Oscillospiraceae bacterium]
MKHCMQCGAPLRLREHPTEGRLIPWCDSCESYRWPVFNTAVSMVVMDEARERVVLIRQYGRPAWVLVAGYVNQGEDAEDAVVREVREELDMTVTSLRFNHSRYFAPTNTLMLNFSVTVAETEPHPDFEVDDWAWWSVDEARAHIKPGSLAEAFLNGSFDGVYRFPERCPV